MTSFMSAVSVEKEGPFVSFAEAFTNFWTRVQKMFSEGTSLQTLETGCWIEGNFDGKKMPLMFYKARDLGYDLGLLVGEGEVPNQLPVVDPQIVERAYLQNATKVLSAMHNEIRTNLNEVQRILG